MDEHIELARWVELEGCFNFRDLGGYPTESGGRLRTGRVFRADGLQHLTASDLDRLCGELGLGAVVDLRSDDEVEEDGRGAIEERVEIHHVPLFPGARARARREIPPNAMPSNMAELYFLMLTAAREPIVRTLELLTSSEVPIVFHCAAGKDRTGVISSLILSLLGVSEEIIVVDYAYSRQNIDLINARLNSSETYQRLMHDLPDGAYDADPESMRGFLDRVREHHGGMADWAAASGFDADRVERLRNKLLE